MTSHLDQSPNQGPKKRPAKVFPMSAVDEVEAVFRKHGYRDWAVVMRKAKTKPERWAVAGEGMNAWDDRAAMSALYLELECLQDTLLRYMNEQESLEKKAPPPPV